MTLTSYEVVRRAIEFGTPDRIPLRFAEFGFDDTHSVAPNQILPFEHQDQHENIDEWGCLWVRSRLDNMGQVKGHPLAEWNALDRYRWPDPDNPALYEGMDGKLAGAENKYVLTEVIFTLFERLHMLHGYLETLQDLLLERERIEMVTERILEYDMRVIDNLSHKLPNAIHGICFTDDWGTQQGPMINPELWRSFFKPLYRRLFDQVHGIGWHVWLHSCGKINALLEDFVELGLDVGNFEQPRTLGIEEIGNRFRGRLCFAGPCDIQQTLPQKDEQQIFDEAKLLINCWGTPQGGFIGQDKDLEESYGATVKKRFAMLNAFQKHDRWRI